MRKFTIGAIAALCATASAAAAQADRAPRTVTTTTTVVHPRGLAVVVDGKTLQFRGASPMVLMGTTMVPMRGIFESIGAYVEYDPANHTIKAQRNNEMLEMRLGSRLARKNGAEIMMEVKPQVIAGTTMVPLRFITEALGAKVSFDQPNGQVIVTTRTSVLGSTPDIPKSTGG